MRRWFYGGVFKLTILLLMSAVSISFAEEQAILKLEDKNLSYCFSDGVRIKVHYTEKGLEENGEDLYFPREVLDAAVSAYQTITEFKGFSSAGFTFSNPDENYAADPDRTIDIYLGDPTEDAFRRQEGQIHASFKDAPCFDAVQRSETVYDATILIPVGYREFIKNWEGINPSSLGERDVHVDLRGTLIHEMLHAVLFYYNKNLNKDQAVVDRKIDWYVEGLARYFEMFAGAKHDFFSRGFRQTLATKVRFSRGGCNYFMRYPDQDFMGLRYENALFWRFLDDRYGMSSIETLSRLLRESGGGHFRTALEQTTGQPLVVLLKKFALAILLKDFGLKEDARYLKDVAATDLVYRGGSLFLRDGLAQEEKLGSTCRTDWIGAWNGAKARLADPGVAGDSTPESDVSGWATDFVKIDLADPEGTLPSLDVRHIEGGSRLVVQAVIFTKGGAQILKETDGLLCGESVGFNLETIAKKEGLSGTDIPRVFLLITNADSQATSRYEINLA